MTGYRTAMGTLPKLLIVRGERDPWIPAGGVAALLAEGEAKRYADPRRGASRSLEIPGAGHLPHLDAPEVVAAAIVDFFSPAD